MTHAPATVASLLPGTWPVGSGANRRGGAAAATCMAADAKCRGGAAAAARKSTAGTGAMRRVPRAAAAAAAAGALDATPGHSRSTSLRCSAATARCQDTKEPSGGAALASCAACTNNSSAAAAGKSADAAAPAARCPWLPASPVATRYAHWHASVRACMHANVRYGLSTNGNCGVDRVSCWSPPGDFTEQISQRLRDSAALDNRERW